MTANQVVINSFSGLPKHANVQSRKELLTETRHDDINPKKNKQKKGSKLLQYSSPGVFDRDTPGTPHHHWFPIELAWKITSWSPISQRFETQVPTIPSAS